MHVYCILRLNTQHLDSKLELGACILYIVNWDSTLNRRIGEARSRHMCVRCTDFICSPYILGFALTNFCWENTAVSFVYSYMSFANRILLYMGYSRTGMHKHGHLINQIWKLMNSSTRKYFQACKSPIPDWVHHVHHFSDASYHMLSEGDTSKLENPWEPLFQTCGMARVFRVWIYTHDSGVYSWALVGNHDACLVDTTQGMDESDVGHKWGMGGMHGVCQCMRG